MFMLEWQNRKMKTKGRGQYEMAKNEDTKGRSQNDSGKKWSNQAKKPEWDGKKVIKIKKESIPQCASEIQQRKLS